MSNFLRKLRINAEQYSDREAIVFGTQRITYKELEEETDKLAAVLSKRLSGRQVPVIIYHTRGIEFIKMILAVIKCDCFYIPLEEIYPVDRVRTIYRDINAEVVISDLLDSDSDMKIFNPKTDSIDEDGNWKKEETERKDQDIIYVMYTSGTTGMPKGIAIKDENVDNLINTFGSVLYSRFEENINVGLIAPFSFDTSVKQIYCALYYAKTLVIADNTVRNFGRKIHDFHNKHALTICDATPSHLKLMLIQKSKHPSKLPYLFIGGENLQWSILKEYKEHINRDCTFVNLYGPTECCVDVSYNIIEDITHDHGSVPIGKEFDNTTLVIKDENGQAVTNDGIGELIVYGKQVGYGYVGNNRSDGYIFNDDGIAIGYRTGDLAMYDDDHNIVILSRKDRQVKINGYRIELGEIESRIKEYCRTQCHVSFFKSEKKSGLVAFVVSGSDEWNKNELSDHLIKYLMPYMIPKEYIFLDSIPLNINGKVDEKKLRDFYDAEKNGSVSVAVNA